MKIGITGTHNVGKTTLTKSLVKMLKDKGVSAVACTEYERQCPLPAGTETRNSVDSQVWILGKQFISEIELVNKFPVVVCDRTMLCNYAYFLWNLKKNPELKEHPKVKIIHEMVDNWLKTYDFIFRLPIIEEEGLSDDGFRSTGRAWQREINGMIDDIIKDKKVEVINMPVESIEQRTQRVFDIVKQKLEGI